MNILVTGGAGFIGSHLCDRLIDLGHRLVVVDNPILGRRANLSRLGHVQSFVFIEMDVADRTLLNGLVEANNIECVFHFAANSDIARSHANPGADFHNTLETTYSVLEAMRRNKVHQIVFASSSAIYGEAPGLVREDQGPLLPISHYGAAKLASEALISSYGENYGIRSWIPRFPNVVGGRSTHGAIFDFCRKLIATPDRLEVLGDGTQVKPYLHVSDLLDAVLLAWERMEARVNVFNIGGTTRCTVQRIAEIVVEQAGGKAEIIFTGGDRGWIGDVPRVDYDTRKIRALGWAPRLDSEAAVRAAAQCIWEHTP